MFNNKTIFISGGTGSFGSRFATTILKKYPNVKNNYFFRDELKQFNMSQKLRKNIKIK